MGSWSDKPGVRPSTPRRHRKGSGRHRKGGCSALVLGALFAAAVAGALLGGVLFTALTVLFW